MEQGSIGVGRRYDEAQAVPNFAADRASLSIKPKGAQTRARGAWTEHAECCSEDVLL